MKDQIFENETGSKNGLGPVDQAAALTPDERISYQAATQTGNLGVSVARHVCDLALIIFDRTQALHGLSESSRNILEKAAYAYDSPLPKPNRKLYQTILVWLRFQADQNLASEDQESLAAVITYRNREIKGKEIGKLGLSAMQEREVLTLSAILRIAHGLNDSGSQQTNIQKVEAARDGVWIVVDGPNAIADAAAAQHDARLWAKIGLPEAHVMESSEAAVKLLPFPKPTEQIGIAPTDLLAEAGRKVMLFHFARMLSYEEGARLGEDIEAVHNMRVATRRLRASFEVFEEAFEPEVLKLHLKGLRATGRTLGTVRDLDVFMEKARHYLDTLPEGERIGMDPLLWAWQEKSVSARANLIAHLDSVEYATFKRKFNGFLQTPGAGVRQPPKYTPFPNNVQELAPVLIYTRLAAARAYHPFPSDAPIERYHALRIELKKFRYTMEYFQEVLGKKAREIVADLKQMQDHLGDLNDAQVATQILNEFVRDWKVQQANLPANERVSIQAVIDYLAYRQAEIHQLLVTFRPAWTHFVRPTTRRGIAQAVSIL